MIGGQRPPAVRRPDPICRRARISGTASLWPVLSRGFCALNQWLRQPTTQDCTDNNTHVALPPILLRLTFKALKYFCLNQDTKGLLGGGPRVVVSTAAFHARVRGSVSGLGGLKETKMFLPHPRVKVSIVGSLRDREVACSASDRQGSNFESCVWRTVSSQSSHHPQEVLLAQFSLYVHKCGLKPDSFHLQKGYFQFDIIIDVLVSSFRFI